jgi:transcriptional regulator of acetoin/glycerol metabolism
VNGEHQASKDRGVWSSRQRFLGAQQLPGNVRPEIARSWMRSRQSGVRPEGDPDTGQAGFDPDGRLLRLAQPILDRLADEVASADMTVILTDPRGLVLDRRAGSAALRRGLDRVLLAPGHFYSEDRVGTNGIGTAAEDRGVAWVVGSEHYAEWLRWLSCAGAPIRDPITGRIDGIIDLTCRLRDTSPLMVPFVKEAAREIEQRLYEDASRRDRELLDRFLAIAHRSSRPVVALNGQTVITNAAAARLLEPADHALLWNHVAEAVEAGTEVALRFRLSQGSEAVVHSVAFDRGNPQHGAVLKIEVEPPTAAPTGRRSGGPDRRPPAVLPGRSLAWRQAWTAAVEHGHTRLPFLITGEGGSGKLALARCVHEQSEDAGRFTVLDATLTLVDGATDWLGQVRARLADAQDTLVLRHLDALDAATGRALSGLLAAGPRDAMARVMATVTVSPDAPPAADAALLDSFPAAVRVPPLRERPEDIADIVPALIRRYAVGPSPRCAPDLLQALMRADWPGNVRQLESLIQGMIARRPAWELTLHELPPEFQRFPWRRLSPMERVERAAILQALALTEGNKVRAAAILGIARATLYRKLKELGIADHRETFA